MMLRIFPVAILTSLMLIPESSSAETKVLTDHADVDATAAFVFSKVPPPRRNDTAAKAVFALVDGERDVNGGELSVLNDGRLPRTEDEPSANFFFKAGTQGGRISADLCAMTDIAAINSYSWHPAGRGPQVYALYGATGTNAGFKAAPARGTDPQSAGWELIAKVDTRKAGNGLGGQYGVNITATSGSVGHYRYLLWDIVPTDEKDPFGNTFFSEIDVVDQHPAAEPERRATVAEDSAHRKTIRVEGGYEIVVDTTGATDLTEWSDRELVPMIKEWYPKIVAMLPSEDYNAPKRLSVAIREMDGVAFASGTRISCSAGWMRRELKGEAVGAVFHELVHVVQQYGRARRNNRSNGPSAGWIVEGIPDYIRWYIYEPQTRGAEISERNIARARYDASYRVSANFLNWVVQNHDKDLIRKLNAVMREGEYREELWSTWTGRTVQELGEQWKAALAAQVVKP